MTPREHRTQRGLTLEQAGKLCGITRQGYYFRERDTLSMSIKNFFQWCHDIDADALDMLKTLWENDR